MSADAISQLTENITLLRKTFRILSIVAERFARPVEMALAF